MGSPIGPTMANIFMNYMESKFLQSCPTEFKPLFYRRYVDDTFTIFKSIEEANKFLEYINGQHHNIKFTMETEIEKKLPFLDIIVSTNDNKINTSVYRKKTFTGLGLSFFSHCPLKFKINAIQTLIHRTYHICNSYINIHNDLVFLRNFFNNNGFPDNLIYSQIRKFLKKIHDPEPRTMNVPKKKIYISLPYFGPPSETMKNEILKKLSEFYKHIDFNIILSNPLKILSFFKVKDKIPISLRSSVIYKYDCPSCNAGSYIGSTNRCFQIRIDEHRGISTRTSRILTKPPHSSIRDHCLNIHGLNPQTKDFKIIDYSSNKDVRILESIYISKYKPTLNLTESAYPLSLS